MKHSLCLSMFAAALLGSGVANAAGTLYASQYGTPDYTDKYIVLSSDWDYIKLVVDTPLKLKGREGELDLCDGATIEFQKNKEAEDICCIFTSVELHNGVRTVFFNDSSDVYNFTFNDDAQGIIAASAGKPITLIQDLNMESAGFCLADSTTLKLNGAVAGETVVLDGVSFTYVGPQEDGYTFKEGEIGFTGFYHGSHNLSLVVGGGSVPEPTTGTLSLLALAGLCARRRRK